MKILWQTELSPIESCFYAFDGALIQEDNLLKYYFFYNKYMDLSEISFDIKDGTELCRKNDGRDAAAEHKRNYINPFRNHSSHHYVSDDFVFGNFIISHHGEWGYVCRKNGETIWKKALRGYLYTEMIQKGNNIVFGTAGQGGHFYSLNLDSGEIVFDFNTKGTCNFIDWNGHLYFGFSEKRNTTLCKIDYNGTVIETINLPGIFDDFGNPFNRNGNLLCMVTYKYKKQKDRELFTPIVHCIEI